jgi:hypothetical protein
VAEADGPSGAMGPLGRDPYPAAEAKERSPECRAEDPAQGMVRIAMMSNRDLLYY